MDKTYSVIPAAPGWFAVVVDNEDKATVLPIAGWVVTVGHREFGDPIILTTPLAGFSAWGDVGSAEAISDDLDYQVFAPGENPLPWAEKWEKQYGRKIASWDVSNWWPSKSPVFATADETLWTDDSIPPEEE